MSFWKNLFGSSKKAGGPEQGRKDTEIIPEPEHELAKQAPDDLVVTEEQKQKESNASEYIKEDLNNKDSP